MAKHKLLLADDSVTIQKVVNLTFADEGIEVVAVGDGDAAMQKFVESVPDLVMVDVNMPGLDGYRICEMIKQDDETKHIPVILLVGSFEPFDEEEARRVGADDFLTKPFQSIRQLVNKVSDLLNGKKSGTLGNEAVAVSSFDDTLEMNPPAEKEEVSTDDFGDAAMDDELIQTSQIGSVPTDEARKFESAPDSQTSGEDADLNPETETADEDSSDPSTEENLPETESTSAENTGEIEDVAADDDEPLPRHENIYEFANEQELADEENSAKEVETGEAEMEQDFTEKTEKTEQDFTQETETARTEQDFTQENHFQENTFEETKPFQTDENDSPATSEADYDLELDDFDLLELPPEKFKDEKTPVFVGQADDTAEQMQAANLSPQDIEAVADRVVEKLSEEVIKKIVREVFLQMTKRK